MNYRIYNVMHQCVKVIYKIFNFYCDNISLCPDSTKLCFKDYLLDVLLCLGIL